jgi:GTP-binding protein Era
LMGVKTEGATQTIFVDTPGIHQGESKALNKAMNRAAASALIDVDLVLLVLDRDRWTKEDQLALKVMEQRKGAAAVIINKVDLFAQTERVLPLISETATRTGIEPVIPISALRRKGLDELQRFIKDQMPLGPHLFPEDQITDRSERFLASELVREKIIRQLGDELPYSTAVEIEGFSIDQKGVVHIDALILVEREGQKKILIGEAGSRLKSIGSSARKDMEKAFDARVMLKLWVKVRSGWSDDVRALKSLGLDIESS